MCEDRKHYGNSEETEEVRKMDQGRLLTIELWAKRNRALVGDSSRMYQVTVSILV